MAIAGLSALVLAGFVLWLLNTDPPAPTHLLGDEQSEDQANRSQRHAPRANIEPSLNAANNPTAESTHRASGTPGRQDLQDSASEGEATTEESAPPSKAGDPENNQENTTPDEDTTPRRYRDRFPAGQVKQSLNADPSKVTTLDTKKMPKQPRDGDILQQGLFASYFLFDAPPHEMLSQGKDPFATEPALKRIDKLIDFSKRETFNLAGYKGNVAASWEALLHVKETQTLTFVLGLDSSGALVIDDQLVIFNAINQHYNELHASVELAAGYHSIRVEHMDRKEDNEFSAARLMYIPEGETQAKIVPAGWFFLPQELGNNAPRIDRIRPRAAEIGADVTIHGSRFFATSNIEATIKKIEHNKKEKAFQIIAEVESGEMPKRNEILEVVTSNGSFVCALKVTQILDERQFGGETIDVGNKKISTNHKLQPARPKVSIDGFNARVKSVSNDQIVITIPVGAADGIVRVTQAGIPSNEERMKISTIFGLVVSVWDMTGYPLTYVNSRVRPPDQIVVLEEPFPLRRSMFPDFTGKSIAVKVEGRLASLNSILYAFESVHAQGRLKIRGKEHEFSDQEPLQGVQLLKGIKQAQPFKHTVKKGDSLTSIAEHYYDNKRYAGRVRKNNPGWNPDKITAGETILLPPIERPRSLIYQATMSTERRWLPFVLEALFEPGDSLASISMGPIYSRSAKRGDFKPAFKVPPQPRLRRFAGNYEGITNAAPIGKEVAVWVGLPADATEDAKLRFYIDGKKAKSRRLEYRLPGSSYSHPFWLYAIRIPQGAGEGEVRARNGIVQSNPTYIDISDRGLIGYYYNIGEPLQTIPDMTSLTPSMIRTDKTLNFTSNVDFQLPFPAEHFAAEWFGSLNADKAGSYTLIVRSDDGFRLSLDDNVVFEHLGVRATEESQVSIELTQGWHDLHIEYFENNWVENITLWWVKPGAIERAVVPTSHLSTKYTLGIPEKP